MSIFEDAHWHEHLQRRTQPLGRQEFATSSAPFFAEDAHLSECVTFPCRLLNQAVFCPAKNHLSLSGGRFGVGLEEAFGMGRCCAIGGCAALPGPIGCCGIAVAPWFMGFPGAAGWDSPVNPAGRFAFAGEVLPAAVLAGIFRPVA